MAIGDQIWVERFNTGRWRPAEVIYESETTVQLKCTDAPDEPDLHKTITVSRKELANRNKFRPSSQRQANKSSICHHLSPPTFFK
jgi:hypothetical protein